MLNYFKRFSLATTWMDATGDLEKGKVLLQQYLRSISAVKVRFVFWNVTVHLILI